MFMLTEDYVDFETAKLLKEKGFDEKCSQWYVANEPQKGLVVSGFGENQFYVNAPTHQMAMRWLREVHKLAFIISPQWAEGDMRNPCRWYWEIRGLEDIGLDVYSNPLCNTYEEAVEAACIYSLKNLI